MKLRKSFMFVLVLIMAVGTLLSACSKEATPKDNPPAPSGTGTDTKPKDDGPKKGGTVTFAMFSAPKGLFNPLLSEDLYEDNVLKYAFDTLLEQKDDLSFGPQIAKSWEFSEDKKTLTMKLRNDIKWHDGQGLTADDVVYTYTTIADPKYTGSRAYVSSPLQGFDDFNAGKSKTFEGVTKVDDYTVAFHFTNPIPNALDAINFYIVPKHIYSKYEVAALKDAKETKDAPIGDGPFIFSKMVTNESYELVRNDNYYKGAPLLDKIVWKVVNQDVAAGLLKTGEIDVYDGLSPNDVDLVKGIDGIKIVENPDFGYQYLAFKLNRRPKADIDANKVNPANYTPNPKVQDKALRQAIAYAINRQGLVDGLLSGHGTVMNAPMPPVSWAAAKDSELNNYPYDVNKAKQMLADAGYKDTDGDGFVETPDGKKLVLNLDFPTGNKVREQSAPIIQENLKAAGLNVNLKTPRDVAAHYDAVEKDDKDMDLYLAGWSLSTDPDPSGIWKSTDKWNYPRWNNPESDRLIAEGLSLKAFDQNYRKSVYVQWQKLVSEELPYVFLYSQNSIVAYSSRLQGVTVGTFGIGRDIQLWYVK